MTQEEKQLLLRDLCAGLPYGVRVKLNGRRETSNKLTIDWLYTYSRHIEDIKPYLHSIPNLTEEEQFQLGRLIGAASYNMLKGDYSYLKELLEHVYKNHIDLFGLIPMGLALEASKELYKT